jgi:hypothetical protein
MESSPFAEHRRYRQRGGAHAFSCDNFAGRLDGLMQYGRKRLAFPMQWCRSLETLAAGAEDKNLERLLLARLDMPDTPPEQEIKHAISRMNWNMVDGTFAVKWQAAS